MKIYDVPGRITVVEDSRVSFLGFPCLMVSWLKLFHGAELPTHGRALVGIGGRHFPGSDAELPWLSVLLAVLNFLA